LGVGGKELDDGFEVERLGLSVDGCALGVAKNDRRSFRVWLPQRDDPSEAHEAGPRYHLYVKHRPRRSHLRQPHIGRKLWGSEPGY
jgi:hypothetical protein